MVSHLTTALQPCFEYMHRSANYPQICPKKISGGLLLECPGSYRSRKAVLCFRLFIQDQDINSFEIQTIEMSRNGAEFTGF